MAIESATNTVASRVGRMRDDLALFGFC